MPDPLRSDDNLPGRSGEMPDVGRTAAFVTDHLHFVPFPSEREHCADEGHTVRPEEPRLRTINPRHRPLALELGLSVHGARPRLVGLDIRRSLVSVEDVVRRQVHERDAERDDIPRALDVHTVRGLRVGLAAVDIRHAAAWNTRTGSRAIASVTSSGDESASGRSSLSAVPSCRSGLL